VRFFRLGGACFVQTQVPGRRETAGGRAFLMNRSMSAQAYTVTVLLSTGKVDWVAQTMMTVPLYPSVCRS